MEKDTKKIKILILFLSMIAMMSNVAIVTTLPLVENHFMYVQNIELYSKLLLTLPSLAIALLAPILGHFIYELGQKKSTIFALVLFAFLGTAGLYLDDIYTLLFSRFLFGISVASLMIVSTSLIGEYFSGQAREKFIGIQGAFISLGGVLFVLVGGYLSDISWRYPFYIYFIALVLLPLVFMNLKEKIASNVQIEILDTSKKSLLNVLILAFLVMLVFSILPTQIPFLLNEKFEASGSFIGLVMSITFISNAFGAILFQKFKEKLDNARIYKIGALIFAFALMAIYFITNKYFFLATAVFFGIGGGLLMVNVSSCLLSLSNEKTRIKNSAYLTSALFFGQFFSPLIFQPLMGILGIEYFFIAIGMAISILVIITAIFRR